ncbi:hypothetical protein NDU88_000352 [Pleurodeles waltl]|uniref:Uncharacterized protein n=1 Tax=Pleurodeles waltl TaxID=8319 RepID=A0AAV7U615_PLEWA|nr:hypothetical protein NDU88_000352 [Pleurodeles waltl]
MPSKPQQSSKKTTSNIIAPNPAGFINCFLLVHALRAVCLHPALEAKKKSHGVILTLAVTDRQGHRPRKHRQQAGGASMGILTRGQKRETGGVPPVSRCPRESSMAALLAAPPWGFRPPYRHPVPGGFHRQEQDGGNGCRGAPGGPCSAHATGMGTAGAP